MNAPERLAAPPSPDGGSAEPTRRQTALVGTWRIVEFVDWDSAGRASYLLGPRPTGYLIYSPSGHVSVHLADTSASNPIYASYVGKYTVQGNVVTHHIELDSTLPGSSGSGAARAS